MRRAVALAQDAGLSIIYTVHDEIVIECDAYDHAAMACLVNSMQEAHKQVLTPYGFVEPIRLEGKAWSPCYAELMPEPIPGITAMPIYIDEKAEADYTKYRKYFE